MKIVKGPRSTTATSSGDSYIILKTTKQKDSDKLLWDIFFWLGESTSQDEMGVAAYKTVELDDLMDQAPVQHREVMGHESIAFTKIFKQLNYMQGGVESGFTHVEAGTYVSKLFRVRKMKHTVKVAECTEVGRGDVKKSMLSSDDVFLLDAGREVFTWIGSKASDAERRNAMSTAIAYLTSANKPISTAIHCFSEDTPFKNDIWDKIMD
ncbi:hypothetical protein JL722_11257 [Aureococcus anophagefferens]|nr:hypothetical protein JL722_11257 [Aureococcus anophagefferens]